MRSSKISQNCLYHEVHTSVCRRTHMTAMSCQYRYGYRLAESSLLPPVIEGSIPSVQPATCPVHHHQQHLRAWVRTCARARVRVCLRACVPVRLCACLRACLRVRLPCVPPCVASMCASVCCFHVCLCALLPCGPPCVASMCASVQASMCASRRSVHLCVCARARVRVACMSACVRA